MDRPTFFERLQAAARLLQAVAGIFPSPALQQVARLLSLIASRKDVADGVFDALSEGGVLPE